MHSIKIGNLTQCHHHSPSTEPNGLALITIGNSLRGDDGVAAAVCAALPPDLLKDICRFDLESYTGFLGNCLSDHKAAIIVDSTSSESPPGTVSILDLSTVLSGRTSLDVKSTHGLSIIDELRLVQKSHELPKHIIFFGIEVNKTNWQSQLTIELKQRLPNLARRLSMLICIMLEILKRDA